MAAHAHAAPSLRLRQAQASLPEIRVYFDRIDDSASEPAAPITPADLSAAVGEHQTAVGRVASIEERGDGVAYVLLVDVSKSVRPQAFADLKGVLGRWIEALGERDRAALITFGDSVDVVQDFTGDKQALAQHAANLHATSQQTHLHAALLRGMELTRRIEPSLPAYRTLVVLTDGEEDSLGGPIREEVERALREHGTPIYALGLYRRPFNATAQQALQALGRFARLSGGEYIDIVSSGTATVESDIQRSIRAVLVADLTCSACPIDGKLHQVQFALRQADATLTADVPVRLVRPPDSEPNEARSPDGSSDSPETGHLGWVIALAAGATIVAGFLIWRRRRAERDAAPRSSSESMATPMSSSDRIAGSEVDETRPAALTGATEPSVADFFPAAPGSTSPGGPSPSAASAAIRIELVEVGALRSGLRFATEIGDRVLVGRDAGTCAIVVTDDAVSARHCSLEHERGTVFVSDLDSTNGTAVNGVPIAARFALSDGDVLRIGETELRVKLAGQE